MSTVRAAPERLGAVIGMAGEQDILARLEALNISFDKVQHGPVMTCDAQAAALGPVEGIILKNLLLKDKKNRLFLVTALAETPISLNLLSFRLGTGKGGLRLAPAEDVVEFLGVQPGSLTPLALSAPSAGGIAFLLDAGVQAAPKIILHPLVNTASLTLTPLDLEVFLRSINRTVTYTDLSLEPVIDRENPPDLKPLADAAVATPKREAPAAATAPEGATSSQKASAKKFQKPERAAREATLNPLDVVALAKTLAAQAAGGSSIEDDLLVQLNALRNAAYAQGYAACRGQMAATLAQHF